jgi:hypothetical protein
MIHEEESFHTLAYKSALSVAEQFTHAPVFIVQALPKFHHICIAYCALVLSEYASEHNAVLNNNRDSKGLPPYDVLLMLKRIRQHYHTSFGGEVPKAMDVAVGRVAAVVSDTNGITRPGREMDGYVSQGLDYEDPPDEPTLPAIGVRCDTEAQYVETVPGGNDTVTDMNNFEDATLHDNFPIQDVFFDGSHMSFVDYFNSTW